MATSLPPPALTSVQIAQGLVHPGESWSSNTLTYSFPDQTSAWPGYASDEEPFVQYLPLSVAQAANFRLAINAWDILIAPAFLETDDHSATGVIRVAFSAYDKLGPDTETSAYAYRPPYTGNVAQPWEGDVWISASYKDLGFAPGSFSHETLLHEIGHALGLKHPFDDPLLPKVFDSVGFTLMSYTELRGIFQVRFEVEGPNLVASGTALAPSTPMVLDIAAIQSVYGADPTTALGPTTYAFNQDQGFIKTIYDAGGIDTIDLASFTRGSNVDLAPGAYSSIGYFSIADQIAVATSRHPAAADWIREIFDDHGHDAYTWEHNLGIAFSTVIENVIGGAGSDTITGNDVGNGLLGGAGDDFIRGLNGDDWMDAGAGVDDVNGNQGVDVVRGGDGADSVRGGQGADTVYGDAGDDPHVNGNIGDDMVYGGSGNDTVFGGQGSDALYGEEGNDWLSGDLGDDVLTGGGGADRFLFRPGAGMDWVTDFQSSTGDRIQLSPGVTYTLSEFQGQVIVDLGGGARIGLVAVPLSQLGDWLVVV